MSNPTNHRWAGALAALAAACAPAVPTAGDGSGDGGDGSRADADAAAPGAACDPTRATTCVGDHVHVCDGGELGPLVDTCAAGGCAGGSCVADDCADAARSVYALNDRRELLRFQPAGDQHTFTTIGTLDCPAGPQWTELGGGPARPFSMSVDRSGRAWVLYTSGQIFHVSTADASCSAAGWSPGTAGLQLFGMGFVADAPGSTAERLFVAGGDAAEPHRGVLASIEPATAGATVRAPLPQASFMPELTGTGDAGLFAYYPGNAGSAIARLDPATAAVVEQWPMPALDGIPIAWAFAHWGGRFYVFVSEHDVATIQTNTQVFRLDPATGHTDLLLSMLPYKIVGAGVSTCAPIIVE